MKIGEKLTGMGLSLPAAPEGGGSYLHVKPLGRDLVYVSGCGPELDGVLKYTGRVGAEVTVEQARACAVDCTLNLLRALELYLGDLDRVKSFVKMTAFVACPHDFLQVPRVADAATQLLRELYGDARGLPTRTTLGVTALADGFPVELEVLVQVEPCDSGQ